MKAISFFTGMFFLLFPLLLTAQSEEEKEAYYLHSAIRKNDFEKVRQMIEQGADVNAQFNGRNALHVALREDSREMVEYLVEAGADVNARRDRGEGITTLHYAVRSFSVPYSYIRILVNNGADVNAESPDGSLIINNAIRRAGDKNEALKIARLLIEQGADLNPEDPDKAPPRVAIFHRWTDMLKLVLENGADPNKVDSKGTYPIHHAVQKKDVDAVHLLKKHGANLKVKDTDGNTPADIAREKAKMAFDESSRHKCEEMVKILSL